MAAEIAQLRQQLQSIKETLEDVRDCHSSKIRLYQGELESLKEDKSQIERVVHELQVEQENQVNQLEQRNAQLETRSQDLEKRYQESLKRVVASSQASMPDQSTPQSSCGTPAQSLKKAVQDKPVTRVVKSEVSLSRGSIVGKPSRGQVTQAIKARPLDTVQGPVVTEPLGGTCAFPSTTRPSGDQKPTASGNKGDLSPGSQSQRSIAYNGEPLSPSNGSEVRPKKVDLSTTHPGSLPNTNRPPAGTKVPAPAPKEDTLDHLGSTIYEQAPGNVYQDSSTSSWGVKAFPRNARDCGPMPSGRDTPHQYKPSVGHHYGHPPLGREHHHHRYRFPPPLSHITQWDMANFPHTTPTMENATVPQGPGPPQLQQAPDNYHGSQSCPSSGYPALSETHYHPSQVMSHAQ